MKARWLLAWSVVGCATGAALVCGLAACSDDKDAVTPQTVDEAVDGATDDSGKRNDSGSTPDGGGEDAQGADAEAPGQCRGPDGSVRFGCDFGLACMAGDAGDSDAAADPTCGSRQGATPCGAFACGAGCKCEDPETRICDCR